MPSGRRKLLAAADWLYDNGIQLGDWLLSAFASIALFLADRQHLMRFWPISGGAAVVALVWVKAVARNEEKYKIALQDEIESLKLERERLCATVTRSNVTFFRDFERVLETVVRELKFDRSERITVYRKDGEKFFAQCRYSDHPEYRKKSRPYFNRNEGVIGRAYDTGSFFTELPDPENEHAAWVHKSAAECNISEERVKALRMKSRAYAAFEIRDYKELDRAAIVVFESTKVGVLDPEQLRQGINGIIGALIVQFLERAHSIEPSMEHSAALEF